MALDSLSAEIASLDKLLPTRPSPTTTTTSTPVPQRQAPSDARDAPHPSDSDDGVADDEWETGARPIYDI
jgi:hypothetical protein